MYALAENIYISIKIHLAEGGQIEICSTSLPGLSDQEHLDIVKHKVVNSISKDLGAHVSVSEMILTEGPMYKIYIPKKYVA